MKENKKKNKYLHMKVSKNENKLDSNPEDFSLNEVESVKWYDELPKTPSDFPESKVKDINALKEEAELVLKKEEEFQNKKDGRSGSSDKDWLRTVMAKGTAADKIAAHIISIQNKPVYNMPAIRNLVNSVKVAKKNECHNVMQTLTELFLDDLLKPDRKLLRFEQQPLSLLQELSSGNATTRKKYLCYWAFEDQLKSLYLQFLHALDHVGKDTVESNRENTITAMFKLLAGNPEQEALLLKNLVNKLGDPNQKVVSKVIYSLTKLLKEHPLMKTVVANEVEKFIFRPNVGSRSQYYSICFLSQYVFSNDDSVLAAKLISIYFAFFKSNIKKGDIDSRMMGALLMGVNRAYPFAKMEQSELSEHIDTLFKLVHISNFSISLHTLCLLYQIVGHTTDRFYCALYKKLLDPHLASSAHQAMFINLVYKALNKDTNLDRVKVFIKRLLQVSLHAPAHLSCAFLYLVSQLIHKRSKLLALTTHKNQSSVALAIFEDDDDDGSEHYEDVPLEPQEMNSEDASSVKNENIDKKSDDIELKFSEDRKPSWFHCQNIPTKTKNLLAFDRHSRNPAFAGGEFVAYEELIALSSHFHPTVALFAKNILDKQQVKYTGDPLQDFTLLRFLERFVFKNPKQVAASNSLDPCLAQRKHYVAFGAKALPVNSTSFRHQDEKAVPVDELFLYKYLQKRQPAENSVKKEDDSDVESVCSEEFNDMLDSMVGNMDDDLDFAEEVTDRLKSKKSKNKKEPESDSDDDISMDDDDEGDTKNDEELTDLEDDGSENEGSDAEALDFGSECGDFDGEIDLDNLSSDDDDDDENDDFKPSKSKNSFPKIKGFGKKGSQSLFAPAEKFSEMLEEAGASKLKVGTAHDVSNKDKAALKQIQWESKRHHFVHGDKRKRPYSNSRKPSFNKNKKRKR